MRKSSRCAKNMMDSSTREALCAMPSDTNSERQPRGELQRARSACAENRIDPPGGLAKIETRVRRRSARDRWPGDAVERAAVAGQVGDVEDVEPFPNQQ